MNTLEEFESYILDFKNDSEEDLNRKTKDVDKIFELFCELYDMGYGSVEIYDNLIEIHTGGWSDNEYLVSVLKDTYFWYTVSVVSSCGGHYYLDRDKWNDNKKHWKIIKK